MSLRRSPSFAIHRIARIARIAAIAAAVTLGSAAVPAAAQFPQYVSPGSLGQIKKTRKEQIAQDVAEARWRLGALRLQPWLALQDGAYVSNAFSGSGGQEVSDFTVTLGAGLLAYLPVGSDVTLAAQALPEYVWWQDLEERRRFNQRYGVGVFAYFNRLALEVTASSAEQQGIVTSESEQYTSFRVDEVAATAEVRLVRSLSLFGGGSTHRFRYQLDQPEDPRTALFDVLDRDEEIFRGGLRARFRGGLTLGLGAEHSQVEFRDPTRDLSNSGTAPLLTLELERGRSYLSAEVAWRSLEPLGAGSRFPEHDIVTGDVQARLELAQQLQLQLYGLRSLTYSISSDFSFFETERLGLALQLGLGRRATVRPFVETGSNGYPTVSSTARRERQDDVQALGLDLNVVLPRGVTLVLGALRTEYDSNLPGNDRSLTQVTAGLRFGDVNWP